MKQDNWTKNKRFKRLKSRCSFSCDWLHYVTIFISPSLTRTLNFQRAVDTFVRVFLCSMFLLESWVRDIAVVFRNLVPLSSFPFDLCSSLTVVNFKGMKGSAVQRDNVVKASKLFQLHAKERKFSL